MLLLAPVLVSCLGAVDPQAQAVRLPGRHNVLFVGNSHTYTNDLPAMYRALARLAGDTALRVASLAQPNFALEDHWAVGALQRSLQGSHWEFVVLQQGTSALPASQANLRSWAETLGAAIRAAGAEPVLYQIWPAAARRADADAALTSYWNAAAAVNGLLAPAGDAFTAALAATPPLEPYAADGTHASREGTYLAALVLLERTLGIAPESLPPRIPGGSVDSVRVRRLQAAARVALGRSPARPADERGVLP
jgi:hypothetical protein